MAIDPRELFRKKDEALVPAPLGGSRAERIQRLQVGGFGLAAMVLMVALADIVISRARETEAASVPETASSILESEVPRDPLADAGVVPDLPDDHAEGAPAPGTGDAPPPVD
jgi:hypothetical protein